MSRREHHKYIKHIKTSERARARAREERAGRKGPTSKCQAKVVIELADLASSALFLELQN